MLRGSWRAARRPGGGRAGPGRRPASVLARGLSPAQTLRRPAYSTFRLRSHCVVRFVRCLPNTLLTCQDVYTRLPLRFSLSGQRSYAIRCARGGGGAWERYISSVPGVYFLHSWCVFISSIPGVYFLLLTRFLSWNSI